MGTAISLDMRAPWVGPEVVDEFFAWLGSVDERFSTYREDSAVSRVRRGEVAVLDCDSDMSEVLLLCEQVRLASSGVFDAWTHSPEGFDPSGLVKGWSIDRGAEILLSGGARNFCINAGGDILAQGEREPGVAWTVGIRNPLEVGGVAKVISVRDMAVATSGAYERGAHITNAVAPGAPGELLSITVVGRGLTLTDAYATAAYAMGDAGTSWAASQPGYGVFAITRPERAVWDGEFDKLIETGAKAGSAGARS
ncbi:MAG: FAD:protein transferase [Chloroflexota bacterium]|nr:FAD:protein transferase [Chloroflexota bacterium]